MSRNLFELGLRWGPAYWSPGLYTLAMRLLRPDRRRPLLGFLAGEVGSRSVLELCCGTGELSRWLKGGRYLGIDLNPAFVRALRAEGRAVQEGDVLRTPWPAADCLVMIDSLYHFLPDIDPLMEKLAAHPARKVILAESVEHLALRPEAWLSRAALWATRVDGRSFAGRFTEDSMRRLLERRGFCRIARIGADVVGVLERP